MESLKFAIVGCGRIGERHAEKIKSVGKLVAVCDIEIGKAKKMAALYDVPFYLSIQEMISQKSGIDVVAICTPNGLHAEHTIYALQLKKHVICEKPMALNVHDCGEMIKAAERVNKRLFIVKQNRFNPPIIAVKKAIDDGHFGKVSSIQLNCFWNRNSDYYTTSDWKGTELMDGGILYTQFSHFIDLMYWLVGDVKEVSSFVANTTHPEVEFEDTLVSCLKFYNGVLGTANFTINSFKKNMEGSLTIFGETGTVKIGGQYLNELEYQQFDNFSISSLPAGNPPNNYGDYVGSMSNHDQVYNNVVDVLTNQGVISTNGFEGLKTVEIIDKIYSSCK